MARLVKSFVLGLLLALASVLATTPQMRSPNAALTVCTASAGPSLTSRLRATEPDSQFESGPPVHAAQTYDPFHGCVAFLPVIVAPGAQGAFSGPLRQALLSTFLV